MKATKNSKSNLKIIIILLMKCLSTIGVYLWFYNWDVMHTLPAATCSIALLFYKHEIFIVGQVTWLEEVKCLFIDLFLIVILLFVSIICYESTNWHELIKDEAVKYLFIDTLLTPLTGTILFGLYSKRKK